MSDETIAAWEKLYLTHADDVYHYLLSLCHDRYLAEDLTSETFLEAHRSYARYNGTCKVSVWLCAIARHLLYRHYEAHLRERYLTDELSGAWDAPDESAEEHFFKNARLRSLYQKIDRLPPDIRAVFCLRVFEDCPYALIADLLHISEANARIRFYRAKQILKQEE